MAQNKKKLSFEEGLEKLEQVVKKLENGDLPLEKSLELFEQGIQLSKSCHEQLRTAEHKVEILLSKDEKIVSEPFDFGDTESKQ